MMDWATDATHGNGASPLSRWRLWSGTLLLGAMMVIVLALCPKEARAGVAPTVIGGLGALGVALAAKLYGEHKANADAAARVAIALPPTAATTAAGLVAGAKE